MQVYLTMKVILVLLVTCELCWTIRVPVTWDEGESDGKQNGDEFSVESFKPQDISEAAFKPHESDKAFQPEVKPIPVEYFEYTAKKPQFAIDVAAFHGVQSPENHYKAYPIRPHTGRAKPELGKHHIFDKGNILHNPLQEFANINEDVGHATPVSSSYEVFHPYEAETPALQDIYKDPILTKIRNDLENSKNRLQQYEKHSGEPDITKEEYLESPQKTDSKLFPHRHRPAPFEIHRSQRRPFYYRPIPVYKSREQYLNHKLRHPWNHNIAKVRPIHYRPIQNHIHQLRQAHALKYDDERNEYPQVQVLENYSDPKDGYDIYERGKDKFVQLRNNVDESINKAVKDNRPATYQKLEIQNNDSTSDANDDEENEFVPIKNYAQVRKTESFRHLPRASALEDAETYDEIKNAPRLREAVKSTKAQTVYSEEGYEDAAYDHAGEQKHASENEGHGGFLKENELSGGKYKAPSVSANYEDGTGSVYRDQVIHAEKWKDDNKDTKEVADEEDYSEDEHEQLLEADNHQTKPQNDDNYRNKRENYDNNATLANVYIQSNKTEGYTEHELDKREASFEVPQLDLNSTFFKNEEFSKVAKLKVVPKKDTIKEKYPYYFKNLKAISRNSPLRYAENLKLIPIKTNGGTEFYDSRSKFECPEVDDVPDPIPEKIKKDGHPDENDDGSDDESSTKGDQNFDTTKKQPRLKGLGDKIDCFKEKYFGENPLDSPFFKEDIISNPEPVFPPKIGAHHFKTHVLIKDKEEHTKSNPDNGYYKLHEDNTSNLLDFKEKLKGDQNISHSSIERTNEDFVSPLVIPRKHSNLNHSQLLENQSSVYNDVIKNIKNSFINVTPKNHFHNIIFQTQNVSNHSQPVNHNITYTHFQNKEDITKSPHAREKRAALSVYEPYKIIKDGQIQDIKKTTTAGNITPSMRQLQSSRVIERVTKKSSEEAQPVKINVNARPYKDISRKDREIKYGSSKNEKSSEDSEIVDVSLDQRRGEPRYEIKHINHKSRYTPVTNTKSMTKEDYEAQTNDEVSTTKRKSYLFPTSSTERPERQKIPTKQPHFDIFQFMPHTTEVYNTAASNTVRKTVSTTTPLPKSQVSSYHEKHKEHDKDNVSDEEYDEYDEDEEREEEEEEEEEEDEEEEEEEETVTTTTTLKPALRRKTRPQTTTQEPLKTTEEPRLKFVTRFRDYKPKNHHEREDNLKQMAENDTEKPTKKKNSKIHDENFAPKFREKKKKFTKSTLVTDTKKYGDVVDGNDEILKDEVDALIGVKHDMSDYMPQYEKDEENKSRGVASNEGASNENIYVGNDDERIDNDEYNDADDDEEADDEENVEEEDDDNDDNDSTIDEEDVNTEQVLKVTTPEPTKRTLVITTDAPMPTTASRSAMLQAKPIVTRKKIEIHNELPVNKSSPHMTQYKQDIKEIEITKESRHPLKRKPNKNVEVLHLYKDDNLAADINKLGVEIFKENLDIRQGPKHGGNYRSAEPSSTVSNHEKQKHSKDDAEASQSKYMKHVELDDNTSNGEDYKSQSGQNSRTRARNSKLIELRDTLDTSMHGGNLRYRARSRTNKAKSQKLIELGEEHDDDSSNNSRENKSYSSSRSGRPMHGGNYRSGKLTEEKQPETTELIKVEQSKDVRRNAALVLNSFVQAAPVLTTTPGFILDPSQRKYYYVDA